MFLKMNTRNQAYKLVKKCNYCGPIFETEWSRWSNCVSVPNFEAIAPAVAEIWRYFDFTRWRPRPSWIFKFLKFLTVGRLKMIELRRRAKFGRNRWNRGRDMRIFDFLQDGGRPPSWICYVCVRTTHEGHLVVFVTVQNLVGIDAVALKICIFFDFTSLSWKRLFTPQNGFFGTLPLNGEQY